MIGKEGEFVADGEGEAGSQAYYLMLFVHALDNSALSINGYAIALQASVHGYDIATEDFRAGVNDREIGRGPADYGGQDAQVEMALAGAESP